MKTVLIIWTVALALSLQVPVLGNQSAMDTQILNAWDSKYERLSDVELQFKLTQDGYPYDIRVVKGFDDPYTIRALLHAILFSGKFTSPPDPAKRQVSCLVKRGSAAPQIRISFITINKSEPAAINADIEDKPVKGNEEQYPPIELKRVCTKLFENPDSPSLKNKAQLLFSSMNLKVNKEQCWLHFARSLHTKPQLERVQYQNTLQIKAAIAAFQQAYKIENNKFILDELEDAYSCCLAFDLQHYSNNSIIIGSAHLLTGRYENATREFLKAKTKGSSRADQIMAQMKGSNVVDKSLKPITLKGSYIPTRDYLHPQFFFHWIPPDTQLAVVGKGDTKEFDGINLAFAAFNPMHTKKIGKEFDFTTPEQFVFNTMFKNLNISMIMNATRGFVPPDGINGSWSQSADILVLGNSSVGQGAKISDKLRHSCLAREVIEGIEVFAFDQRPWNFGQCLVSGSSFNQVRFVCEPQPGIFIIASSKPFLKQIIFRLRAQPNDRAFESSLPEWKNVDTSADAWCIRHYDQDTMLFDSGALILYSINHLFEAQPAGNGNKRSNTEIFAEMQKSLAGVTFSIKGKNVCMKILSPNKKFLEKQATAWRKCAEPVDGNWTTKKNAISPGKVTLNATVLTIESPLDASMAQLGFHMRMVLGDMVVI